MFFLFIYGQSIWQRFFTLESFKNGSTDFARMSNVISFGLRLSVENWSQKEFELWAMGKGFGRQENSWISNYITKSLTATTAFLF